jgi:hypothetical protein
MIERPIICVMGKIAELATALGVQDIKALPGAWEHKLDERWEFAVNGHDHPVTIPDDGERMGVTIEPYNTVVWRYGWAVGFLSPFEGFMLGVGKSDEDELLAALDTAIAKAETAGERP